MLEKKSCRIVGCIGRDEFADILVEKSEEAGLMTNSFQRSPTRPTGHCACLINSHNRSLVAFLEGANDFKAEHLNSIEREIAVASIIYITGFFFAVSPESVMKLLITAAPSQRRQVIFNLSASFVCSRFDSESFNTVFGKIDVLIGNSDEFSELISIHPPDSDCNDKTPLEAGIIKLTNRFPNLCVIITQGSEPILLKVPDKDNVEVIPVPKIPSEEIVDTNGAGDAFVGGLLGSLERGLGLRMGLTVGNFMAQQIIKTCGIKLPTRHSVQDYLDTLLLK